MIQLYPFNIQRIIRTNNRSQSNTILIIRSLSRLLLLQRISTKNHYSLPRTTATNFNVNSSHISINITIRPNSRVQVFLGRHRRLLNISRSLIIPSSRLHLILRHHTIIVARRSTSLILNPHLLRSNPRPNRLVLKRDPIKSYSLITNIRSRHTSVYTRVNRPMNLLQHSIILNRTVTSQSKYHQKIRVHLRRLGQIRRSTFNINHSKLSPQLRSMITTRHIRRLISQTRIQQPTTRRIHNRQLPSNHFTIASYPTTRHIISNRNPRRNNIIITMRHMPKNDRPAKFGNLTRHKLRRTKGLQRTMNTMQVVNEILQIMNRRQFIPRLRALMGPKLTKIQHRQRAIRRISMPLRFRLQGRINTITNIRNNRRKHSNRQARLHHPRHLSRHHTSISNRHILQTGATYPRQLTLPRRRVRTN